MSMPAPVLRYHGGKFRLASWICSLFPPHRAYIEPFGGAASILLSKPAAEFELYNDLDGDVVNVFRVLRDPTAANRLREACRLTPFARAEFEMAYEPTDCDIERARRTLFRAWAGFGSAGATKGATGFRSYTGEYRSANVAHIWQRVPEHIAAFTERLSGVIIEHRPALELMQQHDADDALFFLDPPYLHETRSAGAESNRYYRHEMTTDDHVELLKAARQLRGMVVISGYPSALYDGALEGWTTTQRQAYAAGNRGRAERIEKLWINPACAAAQVQTELAL